MSWEARGPGREPLSLHQLTLLDASPAALIAIAASLGCATVDLFTHVPERARGMFPCVAASDVPALREALDATGVGVCNLEVFPLDRDGEVERFAEALRVGAELGATRATAQLYRLPDEATGIRRFAEFARAAADHGIDAGLEFHAFTDVTTIEVAARIVRAAGCGSLVLDTLHLMRNGAQLDLVAANADLIGFAQLCDGPLSITSEDAWHEAIGERGVPGDGAFPLAVIIASLRPGTVFDVEVPQTAAARSGVSPAERAARAVAGARRVIAAASASHGRPAPVRPAPARARD